MTTAPDIAPTIIDMLGLGGAPTTMVGESFKHVLMGQGKEHRPFVVSSWPLYMAEGEIVTAVDSKARRVANYMPITISTRDSALVLGGPDDKPELFDHANDPGERTNVWRDHRAAGHVLCGQALNFLQSIGTPETYIAPRREALDRWWGTIRRAS
jgi:hypothetical protein